MVEGEEVAEARASKEEETVNREAEAEVREKKPEAASEEDIEVR